MLKGSRTPRTASIANAPSQGNKSAWPMNAATATMLGRPSMANNVTPPPPGRELTLEERLRCSHVKRWQIVRVAREQNEAEHLYQVRVLTLAFAGVVGFTDQDLLLAERWALEHDVPEVITGDLNTKFK